TPPGHSTTPFSAQISPATETNQQVNRSHSSRPAERGKSQVCGNVWEWCSTETKPGRHELKGAAWTSPFNRATPSSFNDAAASMCDDDTGFRCVAGSEVLGI
ncbi:SUMF1/EgtB/PvdO family nonheme iron enzyme, partial [Haloechinothrix alba]|uniref:SUMF1/EgtB/PvdO family nonheme iron enzyme n=1 Tax=Haloechinothrix alba TaxID=664784 RepID=UPI0011301D55